MPACKDTVLAAGHLYHWVCLGGALAFPWTGALRSLLAKAAAWIWKWWMAPKVGDLFCGPSSSKGSLAREMQKVLLSFLFRLQTLKLQCLTVGWLTHDHCWQVLVFCMLYDWFLFFWAKYSHDATLKPVRSVQQWFEHVRAQDNALPVWGVGTQCGWVRCCRCGWSDLVLWRLAAVIHHHQPAVSS